MQNKVVISSLVGTIMEGFRPPRKLTLSEWADEYAYLSAETSAESGKWHSYPYQRGIMDAITDRNIERVVIMKSARVGYTKIINHAIAYHIHQDPCPMMVVQPTDQDAEDYSKDEIGPLFRDTPVLQDLVAEDKSRTSTNTLRKKIFPGGQLLLVGANAPTGFRRVTVRVVFFDEVDGYPAEAGTEGDQIRLGIRRTDTFWNRKIILGSTPTTKGYSRVENYFELTDQRRYFVPCPFCGHMQYLRFPQFKWETGKPETTKYECEKCQELIDHSQKGWMIERGEWRATSKGKPRYAGFHVWAAYSYSPNSTWADIVSEFLETKDDPTQFKTFVNTVFGETWEEKGEAPEWQRLYERRELYQLNVVPKDAFVLTAFCDVQKDRLEVEVVAWGRNMESWSIDYRIFPGEPYKSPDDVSWERLTVMLSEQWPREDGGHMMLERLGVDSGYATQTVYTWARRSDPLRVIVTKGMERGALLISQPREVDVRDARRKKRIYRGLKVWHIATNLAKSEVYGWLRMVRDPDQPVPWGWCHFPEYDAEYFKQLTAEQVVSKVVKGYRKYIWQKVRERNEALDCRVGNRAMAALVGIDRWTEEQWEERRKILTVGEQPKPVRRQERRSSFWDR